MIMKSVLMALTAPLLASAAFASGGSLPELNKINSVMLTHTYSCGGSLDASALFLSDQSKQRNSPELLYNGACGSYPEIQGATAGDDFALIADLGRVPIESVTAAKAFNYVNQVGAENTFRERARVWNGHTYAILTSKSHVRALFVIQVDHIFGQDLAADIRYAVKSYSNQSTVAESPGFDWEAGSR